MVSIPRRSPLVVIADAHLSRQRAGVDAFFGMLRTIAAGPGDVVFLGDIFDLWIGLPRYENVRHRAFLAWCRHQKAYRRIGFVEGNHEFFVARAHAAAFTWCSGLPWVRDGEANLFCHGDRINRADRAYLTFRKATKNPVARLMLQGLPQGPRLVNHLKHRLKHTNPTFRKKLPVDQLRSFAEARFREGAQRIFMGHFHQSYTYRSGPEKVLYTLPDWSCAGWIGILSEDDKDLRQGPWRDLLPITPIEKTMQHPGPPTRDPA